MIKFTAAAFTDTINTKDTEWEVLIGKNIHVFMAAVSLGLSLLKQWH